MLQRRARRARRGWTREAVLEALRTWAREEGRAPRAYEWAPWAAAALGIRSAQTLKWEREPDRWPSLGVSVARWGSWRRALRSDVRLSLFPRSGRGLRSQVRGSCGLVWMV